MQTCMIYGTGGHALTVEALARKEGYDVIAFFDDAVKDGERYREKSVMKYDASFNSRQPVVIAIGNNRVRKNIAAVLKHVCCTLKDSSALLSNEVVPGEGTVVMPGAIVQAAVKIGRHVIINIGAAIDHEVVVGDFVHIGPMCYIGGAAVIGEGANIGAGTIIMRNVVIAPWAEIPPQSLIV